jgi:hypothetical protein
VAIDSSHFAEAMQGRVQIRQVRGQTGATLNVPSTRRENGGVTADGIFAKRSEIKIGVTLHSIARYSLHG